jgi:hypothetical protein
LPPFERQQHSDAQTLIVSLVAEVSLDRSGIYTIVRQIGVLMGFTESDPDARSWLGAAGATPEGLSVPVGRVDGKIFHLLGTHAGNVLRWRRVIGSSWPGTAAAGDPPRVLRQL